MTGFVKNIVQNRNFGFIRNEDNGLEYFFHRDDFSGHWDDLFVDANRTKVVVEFDVADSPKGPRAANVRRTDWPNEG